MTKGRFRISERFNMRQRIVFIDMTKSTQYNNAKKSLAFFNRSVHKSLITTLCTLLALYFTCTLRAHASDSLALLQNVMKQIKENYIHDIKDETLIEGAVCTITCFFLSFNAFNTSCKCSRSEIAPTGHAAIHCPHLIHATSFKFLSQ